MVQESVTLLQRISTIVLLKITNNSVLRRLPQKVETNFTVNFILHTRNRKKLLLPFSREMHLTTVVVGREEVTRNCIKIGKWEYKMQLRVALPRCAKSVSSPFSSPSLCICLSVCWVAVNYSLEKQKKYRKYHGIPLNAIHVEVMLLHE